MTKRTHKIVQPGRRRKKLLLNYYGRRRILRDVAVRRAQIKFISLHYPEYLVRTINSKKSHHHWTTESWRDERIFSSFSVKYYVWRDIVAWRRRRVCVRCECGLSHDLASRERSVLGGGCGQFPPKHLRHRPVPSLAGKPLGYSSSVLAIPVLVTLLSGYLAWHEPSLYRSRRFTGGSMRSLWCSVFLLFQKYTRDHLNEYRSPPSV